MTELTPTDLAAGANTPLARAAVSVTLAPVGTASSPDVQALLIGSSGRVRGDFDFVFYNAPRHRSGTVQISTSERLATVAVDLPRIEDEVERIVICQSFDHPVESAAIRFLATGIQNDREVLRFGGEFAIGLSALMVGEFYRRAGGWKFRAIGQGWSSGLAGLAGEFGVAVDADDSPALELANSAPTASTVPSTASQPAPASYRSEVKADWYRDPRDPTLIRWWDSRAWTEHARPVHTVPGTCPRCGQRLRKRLFARDLPSCRHCEPQIRHFMNEWTDSLARVLADHGASSDQWHQMWDRLRFEQVPERLGQEAASAVGLAFLERYVTFAFADGEIEENELADFYQHRRELSLPPSSQLTALQHRIERGREITKVMEGDLPQVNPADIHLDSSEILYLDLHATQIRILARGPKMSPGRLLVSNKNIRFIGAAGEQLNWNKVVRVHVEHSQVVISSTTTRGSSMYQVHDAPYVGAVVEGALRVAKRRVLIPGKRDSRSISPHVRSAVYQRCGGKCVECGSAEYLEFDHILPLSLGGATSEANLQLLCRACNLRKGNRI